MFRVSTAMNLMNSLQRLRLDLSAILFPLFILFVSLSSLTSNGSREKEKTLAMIKPDGLFGNYTDEIKKVILESGFGIIRETVLQLDKDSAAEFYAEHASKSFFPNLISYMTSGPVLVMILEKEAAVSGWRALIGPTDSKKAKISHPLSIRAMCGLDSQKNCVHGSDSIQSAEKEISFFFKDIDSEYSHSCFNPKASTLLWTFLHFSSLRLEMILQPSPRDDQKISKNGGNDEFPDVFMLFSWMQNKLHGKQGTGNSNAPTSSQAKQDTRKEEFNDWPQALLAIGTFGNNGAFSGSSKTPPPLPTATPRTGTRIQDDENPSSSSDDFSDFTPEEVGKLQKELMKLLSRKPRPSSASSDNGKAPISGDLPLDKFLNCPSSLEVDRRISCNTLSSDLASSVEDQAEEGEASEEDVERTISVILHKCKDLCAESNRKKTIGKRSISFLFKKMFVCANGFAPAPSLRDTLQESRMEKLLRTMLHKKIHPRNSSRASSMKNYIEDRHKSRAENEEENKDKAKDGHKWVKTDSEYIVLEI